MKTTNKKITKEFLYSYFNLMNPIEFKYKVLKNRKESLLNKSNYYKPAEIFYRQIGKSTDKIIESIEFALEQERAGINYKIYLIYPSMSIAQRHKERYYNDFYIKAKELSLVDLEKSNLNFEFIGKGTCYKPAKFLPQFFNYDLF